MRAPEQVGRERRQMAGCMNSRRIPERPLLLPLRPGVTPNRPAARGRVPALRPRSWTAGKRHRSDYDGPVSCCPRKWCKSFAVRQDAEGVARSGLPRSGGRPVRGGHREPG